MRVNFAIILNPDRQFGKERFREWHMSGRERPFPVFCASNWACRIAAARVLTGVQGAASRMVG